MLGCLVALRRRVKALFKQLRANSVVHGCKKAKRERKLWSRLNVSITDFAAMEMSNQFKKVLEVIDENGGGKISASELSQMLFCLGYEKSIATKEAEGMVREMDRNGDGFVDLDEFMDAVINNAGSVGRSGSGGEEDDEHLMDAFLVLDTDKNGKISAKGLRQVLVKLGCDKCSLGECRRMIKGVDKNGDGFVDFEEFQLMLMKDAS